MFFFSTLKIFKFNFFKLIFMYHIHLCDIDFFFGSKIFFYNNNYPNFYQKKTEI